MVILQALLFRSQCPANTLERVPVSVKEGLEYYHTMVWPANTGPLALRQCARLTRVPYAASVRAYTALCRDPLKIALFFEKKIGVARAKSKERAAAWVGKYLFFLQLPIHDVFLCLIDPSFKVVEYCRGNENEVSLICLNCPLLKCRGCELKKPVVASSGGDKKAAAAKKRPPKKTVKVKLKVKRFKAVPAIKNLMTSPSTGKAHFSLFQRKIPKKMFIKKADKIT